MKKELEKILRLKFDERNRNMIKAFAQEKQKFNARGLLNSSGTVVAMHEVAKNELNECKNVIITTVFKILDHLKLIPKTDQIEKICISSLKNRKNEIEGIFFENSNHIVFGLQDTKMLEPFISLNDYFELKLEEMKVCISMSHQLYLKEHGGNILSLLKNRFLNRNVIASSIIVVIVIAMIANFLDIITRLQYIINNLSN